MSTLRVDVGRSPIASEHHRLMRTALARGELVPEIEPGATLEGDYAPESIRIARAAWLERMRHEHHSSAVFARLLPQLVRAEASLEYKTVALRMAMDELRHAALCAGVVRLLGGEPELEVSLETEALPEHAGESARVCALRNVMFVSCLSETIATTLLAEERELTREPHIRRVEEQLAADEVLHGRFGWAYAKEVFPQLDADERASMERYLPLALGSIEAKMLAAMPLGAEPPARIEDELAALGVTTSARGRELLALVLEDVIVPALSELGLDAEAAWRARRA